MKIRTEFVHPPIPNRSFDWSAIDDDTYDGPGSRIGFGATEQQAVSDLLEQFTLAQITPEDTDPGLQEFLSDAKALRTKMEPQWTAWLAGREDVVGTGETEIEAVKHLADAYRESGAA